MLNHFLPYSPETGYLTEPGIRLIASEHSSSSVSTSSLPHQSTGVACVCMHGLTCFYMGAGDLKLGPHACTLFWLSYDFKRCRRPEYPAEYSLC